MLYVRIVREIKEVHLMKKLTSILLVIIMLFTMVPASVFAAEQFTEKDFFEE